MMLLVSVAEKNRVAYCSRD